MYCVFMYFNSTLTCISQYILSCVLGLKITQRPSQIAKPGHSSRPATAILGNGESRLRAPLKRNSCLSTKVAKMQKVHCQTFDELSIAIEAAGPDALYRGQTDNYMRSDGSPSLTTSFARHGCVPDLMLRWYHYAR